MRKQSYIKNSVTLLLALLLAACSQVSSIGSDAYSSEAIFGKALAHDGDYYLAKALRASSPTRERYQLQAAQAMLQQSKIAQAQEILASIHTQTLPSTLIVQKQLLNARLKLLSNHTSQALDTLTNIAPSEVPNRQEFQELLAAAYARDGKIVHSIEERIRLGHILKNSKAKKRNEQAIWQTLERLSTRQLSSLKNSTRAHNNPTLAAWLELAYLAKTHSNDPQTLATTIKTWRKQHSQHAANALLPKSLLHLDPSLPAEKNKVVLLLPLHGKLAAAGQAVKNGFMAAFYADKRRKQPLEIEFLDSSNTKNIISLYKRAIDKHASFIAGPLAKKNVDALLANGDISVPTLALNYSRSRTSHSHLFQFGLSPLDEARQAAEYAWQSNHSRAIIITPKGEWGQDLADNFDKTFSDLGGTVIEHLAYKNSADLTDAIKHLLKIDNSQQRAKELRKSLGEKIHFIPHRREDFDLFFLVATPQMARQIRPLLKFYFAGNIPVYATSSVYTGIASGHANRDLEGIYFCDIPWILDKSERATQARKKLADLWPNNYNQYIRLYALGMDVYRLSHMPTRLATFPKFSVQGATGALTMDSQNHIHRQLLWAQMHNGQPKQLSS